jgi:hypothetical protein
MKDLQISEFLKKMQPTENKRKKMFQSRIGINKLLSNYLRFETDSYTDQSLTILKLKNRIKEYVMLNSISYLTHSKIKGTRSSYMALYAKIIRATTSPQEILLIKK